MKAPKKAPAKKARPQTTKTTTPTKTPPQTTKKTTTTTTAMRGRPMPMPLRNSSRDALLAAALHVLTKNPGATTDDVVAAAGVSRATLFRYFPSREALLREVGVVAIDALKDAVARAGLEPVTGNPLERARGRLRCLLEVLVTHGEQLRFLVTSVALYDDPTLEAASAAVDQLILPIVNEAVVHGVIRANVNMAWLWSATDALIFAAWTEVARGTIARNDAAGLVEAALLDGFGGRHGKQSS